MTDRKNGGHAYTKIGNMLTWNLFVISGGSGYSKIKRAPAYTFGHLTKVSLEKPVTTPYAPMFNCQGMSIKGGTYYLT